MMQKQGFIQQFLRTISPTFRSAAEYDNSFFFTRSFFCLAEVVKHILLPDPALFQPKQTKGQRR
jgi:hypothetical protein